MVEEKQKQTKRNGHSDKRQYRVKRIFKPNALNLLNVGTDRVLLNWCQLNLEEAGRSLHGQGILRSKRQIPNVSHYK